MTTAGPALVRFASMDLAYTQAAAHQSTKIQLATARSVRAMRTSSSGEPSPRASSLASTPPESTPSPEKFLEDDARPPCFEPREHFASIEALIRGVPGRRRGPNSLYRFEQAGTVLIPVRSDGIWDFTNLKLGYGTEYSVVVV